MTIAVAGIGLSIGNYRLKSQHNMGRTAGAQRNAATQHTPTNRLLYAPGLIRLKKSIHKSAAKHFQKQVLGD